MKNSKEALPDTKDNKALKAYFEKVYPDLDFERVYTSDMKKMVKWLEELQKNEIEIKLAEQPESEEQPVETENVAEPVTVAAAEPEEAPKPKRTRKKKTDEEK